MPRSTPPSVSSTSSDEATPSSKSRRHGSRTLVACEACKKRKTKCSGRPSPCETCHKLDTFCHFNSKLDARRKTAYKPVALHEKKEYIFSGILRTLKFNDSKEVTQLIELIRSNAPPQQIAACLKQNLQQLQDRSLIPALDVDENDIVSLGLQALFSHRGKRATFISKDQKSYPTGMQKSDLGNSFGNSARNLQKEEVDDEDDDPQFITQDHLDSPETIDEPSPITTETSRSLNLDDNASSLASTTMDLQRQVVEVTGNYNTSTLQPKNGLKRKSFKDKSIPQVPNSAQRQLPSNSRAGLNYGTGPANSLMYTYSHDRGVEQTSPTDRFYMLFNPNVSGSPDDRLPAEHMQGLAPMGKPTLTAGNMSHLGWSNNQWNRETIVPAGMNDNHNPHFHDSMFTENMFHHDQSMHNQQNNRPYS